MATAPKKRTKPVINLAKVESTCEHCRFFRQGERDENDECWRYPAKAVFDGVEIQFYRDIAFEGAFCGEFKPKN